MKTQVGALFLLFLILLVGCRSSVTEQPVVRIGYLPVVHGLPLYVALEERGFEKSGIKVQVIAFQAPNQIIDALLAGRIDFGASATTAAGITGITHVRKPGALRIFSLGGNDRTIVSDVLIAHKDSEISSIKDLSGKTLGILPGIQWRSIANHVLVSSGVDRRGVRIVDISPALSVQALGSKQIDALLTVEPARAIAMDLGIAKDIEKAPVVRFVASPFYAGAGVVRADFLKEHPELSKKVIEVFHQATLRIRSYPEAVKAYLPKYTPLNAHLVAKVDVPIFKSYFEFDELDLAALQKFYDIFETYDAVKEHIIAKEVVLK